MIGRGFPGAAARAHTQLWAGKEVGDRRRSRAAGGAGLGLSSVDGVIRSFGGSITLETEPGGGTTFRIFLPVAHEEPEEMRATIGPAKWRITNINMLT